VEDPGAVLWVVVVVVVGVGVVAQVPGVRRGRWALAAGWGAWSGFKGCRSWSCDTREETGGG
jgi:hypothetical protein